MEAFVLAAAHYGYSLLFAVVLAESLGFPIPAAIGVLAAGAAAAQGALVPWKILATAVGAMLIGDNVLFFLGRRTGWWLLGVLCRLSLNPETCVARSAEAFYKRGRVLLIFAKFVPGVNTLAPPLAGSMNLPVTHFWALDTVGILLYIGSYLTIGYVFSDILGSILRGYSALSTALAWGLGVAVAIWLANRVRMWHGPHGARSIKVLTPKDVAQLPEVAIYDVRSHGYHDRGTMRIQGSARLDPNAISLAMDSLPRDREIILYCTCIREATAIKVAQILARNGVKAMVLKGGLAAWKKAGFEVEPVPEEEVMPLPRFA